jgi:hypothetical protein
MRRIRLVAIALIGAAAIGGAGAAAASAKPKVLEVSAESHSITSKVQVSGYFAEGFTLKSTKGEEIAICEQVEDAGHLTTNDAKKDVFKALTKQPEEDECYLTDEPDLGESGTFNVTEVTIGTNGKATGAVEIKFSSAPAPYQHCVYKSSRLKGTNTVTGTLEIELGGRLKGSGCHLNTVELVPNFEVPFMLDSGSRPELEVSLV